MSQWPQHVSVAKTRSVSIWVAIVFAAVVAHACGAGDVHTTDVVGGTDPGQDPSHWLGQMKVGSTRGEALGRLEALLEERLEHADGLMDDPGVEGYVAQVAPPLIDGFISGSMTSGGEDMAARNKIIEILSMMESEDAVPVYEQALADIDGERADGARSAARAIADLCRSKSFHAMFIPPQSIQTKRWRARCAKGRGSIDALLSALESVRTSRLKRGPNAVNTPVDDALSGAVISALGNVVLGTPEHPRKGEVIATLIALAETPDTTQDLYLNIEAIRFLGRIGDRRAIPLLIRSLFMSGRRRPLVLKEIARVALMHIEDLDAVAEALVKAGRMQDEALNSMQRGDPSFDVRIIKEQVAVTLGLLGVRSNTVTSYLMEELRHTKADQVDRAPARGAAVGHIDTSTSRDYRRMFAAQALGRLRHEPALPILLARMKTAPSKGRGVVANPSPGPTELAGMMEAVGDFLMPAKTNEIFLGIMAHAKSAALLDRAGWRLSLQAPPELATKLEERASRMEDSSNYQTKYIPALRSGAGCITIECNADKLNDSNAAIRERAAHQLVLVAQDDGAASDRARTALLGALARERDEAVIRALVFSVDRLSPQGGSALALGRLDQIMLNLQSRPLMDPARLAITGLRGRLAGGAKLRSR